MPGRPEKWFSYFDSVLEQLEVSIKDGNVFLPAVLERWFGQTRSEWRRRIEQGGVSLDGEPLSALARIAVGRHRDLHGGL